MKAGKFLKVKKMRWSPAGIFLITAVALWHMFTVQLDDKHWRTIIESDGAGYYAFLPATFIYHDLNYRFAEKNSSIYQTYTASDVHLFGLTTADGKRTSKYSIGTSILELPFFLIAWAVASPSHFPSDGYSFPFQLFICVAGIFYLLAGLLCIRKLLLKMNFDDRIVMLVLLFLFFGTNLYYYALEEPSMSHIYSFAMISFFLLRTFNLAFVYSRKNLFYFTLSLALIILIRPSNGVILLFVPFFFNKDQFKQIAAVFRSDKAGVIFSLLLAAIPFFLQALEWKIATGEWQQEFYPGEHLNFLDPHIFEVLFSWRKGLFIYTPMLALSIAGLFFMPSGKKSLSLVIFLAVNCYVISSWHDWSYGGSFGMRPFVDTYSVFAIPLSYFLQSIWEKLIGISVFILAATFIFLNLFQIYQFHIGILPYEYMTWKKYKRIFLHGEKVFSCIYFPGTDLNGRLPENSRMICSFLRNFDNDTERINRQGLVSDFNYFSAPGSVLLDGKTKISPYLRVPLKNILVDSLKNKLWIQVNAKIFLGEDATDAKMVFSFQDPKNAYEWNGFPLIFKVDKTQSWCDYQYAIPLPEMKSPDEFVSVYLLKNDDKVLYLDDLQLSFWEAPVNSR